VKRPRVLARRPRARATRAWSFPAFALALLAEPGAARADVAPLRLTLAAPGCGSIDEARLRALVAIEMATISADAQPRATAVRLACAGNHVVIDVAEAGATPGTHSELDVSEAAEATRLRVLALAITEQVALSWRAAPEARASLAVAPAPSPARIPDVAMGAGLAPAATRASPIYAQASLRRAGRPGTWLTGLAVGGELTLTRWLALALALDVETGDAKTSAATVAWSDLSSFLGVAVGAGGARWRVTARPGLSVGLARLSPTPDAAGARGTAFSAAWAGPSLALHLRRLVGRAVFVQLEAEGGLTTRRIVGLLDGDSPLFQVAGPWASLGLGGGFMLGR
jgi:hypothetical protein